MSKNSHEAKFIYKPIENEAHINPLKVAHQIEAVGSIYLSNISVDHINAITRAEIENALSSVTM